VILAKRILKERGYDLSEKQVVEMRSTRIRELAVQEKESPSWIILAFITAFVVPFIGLILGLSLLQSKKLLPDGTKVFTYTDRVRSHGKTITVISCIMLAGALISIASIAFSE
jgi:hypothetical protein